MDRATLMKELAYLNKDNDPMQQMVTENVLAVYDVLDKQGHSGFSFNYVTSLIRKLIFENGIIKPILPYEEDPDDWYDKGDRYQNLRRSSVFYDKDTGKYADIDKCVVTDDDGETWCYRGGWFRTFNQIKVPYKPDGKMWYVYIEPTVEADDGQYIVKSVEYR